MRITIESKGFEWQRISVPFDYSAKANYTEAYRRLLHKRKGWRWFYR